MRRVTPTHILLVILTAAFAIGWTTEEMPAGDTQTITRDNVIYADEGSTIQVYLVDEDTYQLVKSIETDPQATHESRDHRHKKHKHHSFSCSCAHAHDHDYDHRDHHTIEYEYHTAAAQFAVTGSSLLYVYDKSTVVSLDISAPAQPREVSRLDLGWEIESIALAGDEITVAGAGGAYLLDARLTGPPREVVNE